PGSYAQRQIAKLGQRRPPHRAFVGRLHAAARGAGFVAFERDAVARDAVFDRREQRAWLDVDARLLTDIVDQLAANEERAFAVEREPREVPHPFPAFAFG